jgi:hypothetical protein
MSASGGAESLWHKRDVATRVFCAESPGQGSAFFAGSDGELF